MRCLCHLTISFNLLKSEVDKNLKLFANCPNGECRNYNFRDTTVFEEHIIQYYCQDPNVQ